MSFPAYPEYKDSGVEWLGEVPAGWRVERLKDRFELRTSNVDKHSREDEKPVRLCNYTDVYYGDEIASGDGLMLATARQDEIDRFELRSGDVLITKDSETADDIAVPAYVARDLPGVLCGYHLAILRSRGSADGAYLRYWFLSTYARSAFEVRANGLTRVGLSQSAINDVCLAFPPASEQRAIATFLDRETARIDAAVAAQERLIALLAKKRAATISHAVTKGLDPNAPMKDSGIEWLGQIPAHWKARPIRKVARLESGHTPSRSKPDYWVETECVIPWVTTSDVKYLRDGRNIYLEDTAVRISPLGLANSSARLLPANTVFLSRTASVGFSGIMAAEMAVSQDFAAWICGEELLPEYLLLCLRSMQNVFASLMIGSTHKTIYMPDIEDLIIAMPPVAEQRLIARTALAGKKMSEDLIDSARRSLELLQERRAALISAAVTGKIDVRSEVATDAQEAA